MNDISILNKQIQDRRVKEFQIGLKYIYGPIAVPLYLVFLLCDWLFAPNYFYVFGLLRLITVVLLLTLFFLYIKKESKVNNEKLLGGLVCLLTSVPIVFMCWKTGGGISDYYAGLNLVFFGTTVVLPWRVRNIWIPIVCTYVFYYGMIIYVGAVTNDLIVHTFFIIGTIVACFINRIIHEKITIKQVISKHKLEYSITNRDKIIEHRINENKKLLRFSTQFSPQVVKEIRRENLKLEGKVKRRKICALYIDIAGFTKATETLNRKDLKQVLDMFIMCITRIFIKHDITIDNILGDCVLGFCNSPISHEDYTERVLTAAIEIQESIALSQSKYLPYWKDKFSVKIGISEGYADVGFYGDGEYFYRYTAIGSVMNIAASLCKFAKGAQILVCGDTIRLLQNQFFKFNNLGHHRFSGLRNLINVNEVLYMSENAKTEGECCKVCGECLCVHKNCSGIFDLICHKCLKSKGT